VADITDNRPISGRLQALVLSRPIEVWTDDDATSGRAYTEQGPRPGLPEAEAAGYATLQADGEVTGTADYKVRCQHAGLPGQVDHGMSIAVKRDGDPLYLGYRPAGVVTGWEPVFYDLNNYTECSLATDGAGSICIVARKGRELFAKVRAADGTIGGSVTVHTDDGREVYWPAVGAIEGDFYVIAWRRGLDGTPTNPVYELAVWRSTDKGATWTLAQDYATDTGDTTAPLATPVSGTFSAGRIRWAYRDGEVVVLAHIKKLTTYCDYVRQYAGPGLVSRLDVIETVQGSSGGWGSPDVVATPTGFLVAALGPVPTTGGSTELWAGTIGSAWQPLSTTAKTDSFPAFGCGATTTLGGGQELITTPRIGLALAWDPANVGWIYVVENSGTVGGSGTGWCAYTVDGGQKWVEAVETTNVYTSYGSWFMSFDHAGSSVQGNCPRELDAVWYRGRVVLAHTWDADTSLFDDSVALAYLGGWHDLAMPFEDNGVTLGDYAGWRRTWFPYEKPDNQDFTTTTTGTSSSALTGPDGELVITSSSATATHFYRHSGTAYSDDMDAACEWEMRITAGTGSTASTQVGVRLRLATTTHGIEIEVNLAGTQLGVRDTVAGTHLSGSPFSGFVSGTRYRFALAICMNGDTGAGRNARLWYRPSDHDDDQRWTELGAWTLADDSGAGGTVPHLEWGNIVATGLGGTLSSAWRSVQWAIPEPSIASTRRWGTAASWCKLDRSSDYPDLLMGKPLGTSKDWAMDGLELAGRRGPGFIGDGWRVPVSGDYEIARALTLDTPTRRIHHRTKDTSAQVVIPWAVDAARPGVEDTEHPPMMALHIDCNWRTAELEYLPQGGAWTSAASIDTAVLDGVSFTRIGRTLRASATGSTVYLHRDEVGPDWTVEWDDGAGTEVYRHLSGNSPGRWSSSTSEPRARLELESTESGDPTTGGVLSLWSPSVTVLVAGVTATAWRLRIPTQPTADGDLRTKLAWCDVHPFALPPSWGRGFTAIPGHDRVQLEGDVGVRVSRAPASRELRIAWDEGVDESDLAGSAEVRFVTPYSSGSEPAASLGEIPRSVVSMLERQDGRPVGWVAWDRTASGAVVIRRQAEQLWGTVDSAPDLEVVLGDVGETEVVRVATLTIREEV
jgi:hypothetical protein